MSERRRATRQKSFLRGCIYFNDRRSAIDCLVRDLSAAGARLIFSDRVNIPDAVDLYIPQKEEMLRARVEWRHGEEVGVSFTRYSHAHAPARPLDVGKLAERVARLEAEMASMRRTLRRLKADIAGEADDAS
jgi:PilZ domain